MTHSQADEVSHRIHGTGILYSPTLTIKSTIHGSVYIYIYYIDTVVPWIHHGTYIICFMLMLHIILSLNGSCGSYRRPMDPKGYEYIKQKPAEWEMMNTSPDLWYTGSPVTY